MTQQYDLFGDTEAAEARRAARLAWDAGQPCDLQDDLFGGAL